MFYVITFIVIIYLSLINYSVLQYKLLLLQEFSSMAKGRKTRNSRNRSPSPVRSRSPAASISGSTTVPPSAMQSISLSDPTPQGSSGATLPVSSSAVITNRMYAMQTPVELKAPKLEHATADQYKSFLYKFRSYKEEDNGIQNMVQLVSIVARKAISLLLKIDVADFLKLSDDKCQDILNEHFRIDNNSNYKSVVKKISMNTTPNDAVDLEAIQVYVNRFLNLVYDNPSFLNQATGGASKKIMNDLFIEGFSPPFFKSIVKELGTTCYEDTVEHMARVYEEMEIYLKYQKKFMDMNKYVVKQGTKAEVKPAIKQPDAVIKCTTTKCNGTSHTPDRCFIMHPELRNVNKESSGVKKSMVATVSKADKFDDDFKDSMIADQAERIISLRAELAAKSDKEVQKNTPNNIKPIYIDSGNNYSLLSSIYHKDTNSHIVISTSDQKVETAGGHELEIQGHGVLESLPAIYVPSATASLLSVQQFCEKRDAVMMFLKDGAVGLKLDKNIIYHLLKIKEIAEKNKLVLLSSTVNQDNLYEIDKLMSNSNLNVYQGQYKWDPGLQSYATFYQSAEFTNVSDDDVLKETIDRLKAPL